MRISVVILTHNSSSHIRDCLDSVLTQRHDDLEIIIVDNGSSDCTVRILRDSYPQAALIQNSDNKGASEARNQAISQATGEWILTLDSDAVLGRNFFSPFANFLQSLKDEYAIGTIVPKILNKDADTIYSLGSRLTPFRRFYNIGSGRKDTGEFDGIKRVFGACCASAFYRKDMLDVLKDRSGFYFDKDLFFMGEDVDLAWRSSKEGWRACFCPACVSTHLGNGAGTKYREKKFYSIRNRFIMMHKNESKAYLVFFFLPLFFYEIARLSYLALKGEGGIYISALRAAAGIIKKR